MGLASVIEVANAYIALTVKMPGVKRDIESALGAVADEAPRKTGTRMGNAMMGALGGIVALGLGKAVNAVTGAIDGAVARVDTLNAFPKVMKNLGYSADDAEKSINRMSDGLTGLPTALNDMAGTVQILAPLTGGLSEATELSLALNNALIAGGKSTDVQKNAMEQYSQMLSVGKVDMAAWRSMMSAMPGQLNQVSESLLGTGHGAMDLYDAMKDGTVGFDDFNQAILTLNTDGTGAFASFEHQARDSTDGIATSQANLNTAITRGLANLIQKFRPQITQTIAMVTSFVNGAFVVVAGFIDWVAANGDWLGPLAIGILAATGAVLAWRTAQKAWMLTMGVVKGVQATYVAMTYGMTGATYAFNGALKANPIGLIITAIVGLVAALVWFFTQTKLGKQIWENVVSAISSALDWLGGILSTVFDGIGAALDWLGTTFESAFDAIGTAATWLWENAIKPAFDGIGALFEWVWSNWISPYISLWVNAFRIVGAIAVWLYENAIKPAWEAIVAALSAAWSWLSANVFAPIGNAVQKLGEFFGWLWTAVIVPVWNGIVAAAGAAWAWLKAYVFTPLGNAIGAVGQFFTDLWVKYVTPVWEGIRLAIDTAWRWIDRHVFTPFKAGVDLIARSFEAAKIAIGRIWDGIKRAAAEPINFVLDVVWNKGLRSFWNDVMDELNLKDLKLPKAPLVKFAEGGVLPGYTPGRDVHTFYSPTGGWLGLSGGEAIMRPEFTRAIGGAAGVDRLNAAARAGRSLQFANGGVYGGERNPVDFMALAFGFLTDPLGSIKKHIIDGIIRPLGAGGNIFQRAIIELPVKMLTGLVDKLTAAAPAVGGGPALARVQALLPGSGLAITSTYRSPAENRMVGGSSSSLHMDASNPAVDVAGSVAAMNAFAIKAAKVGGWRQLYYNNVQYPGVAYWPGHADHVHLAADGGVFPKLYDQGGWLPHGGVAVNLSGRPEAVLSPDQSEKYAAGGIHIENLTVQDGEDLVQRIEAERRRALARAGVY